MKEAGNAVAGLGGDPEIRAAGVEDDLESLGRCADSDLREVFYLLAIGYIAIQGGEAYIEHS